MTICEVIPVMHHDPGATISAMPAYAYGILFTGWIIWVMPFILAKRNRQTAQALDRRARWGMLLNGVAYAIVWQGRFWERSLPLWRLWLSVAFLLLACVLSWSGTRFLGRQWRIDAGVNADHELVMAGPYRVVRHPIYASMLCLLLGTAFMITPWYLFLIALMVFICGTEIRVQVEESLLSLHFGERFTAYKNRVPAYIPFLR
jgi:protein-S-isoprenylcysteine O-methyltransferase Ste14